MKSGNSGVESALTMDIDNLRRQHDAAEEMAAHIVAIATCYRDEYDAIPIARLIGKLNALLRVHFAYEDSVLYPRMIRGGDAEAAATASQFDAEMGTLAREFEEFARRWSSPAMIAESFDLFREEATAVFGSLGARIERENDLLYPLARRMTDARAA
jgi:iron-sulfur cluster repair protein YtfE (RIC family)